MWTSQSILLGGVFTCTLVGVTAQPNTTTVTTTTAVLEPLICEEGGEGLFFPAFANEHSWNSGLRAFLYLIGMLWVFAGAAMAADSFMCAIETITSKQKVIVDENTGEQYHVRVWNPTVANLTLMALGSSAPEILLTLIEIVSDDFYAGSLGPSTIVGSAAFNLLVIIAICTVAVILPKRIDQFGVYVLTASFSVGVYIWLLVILEYSSPDVIELWEALVTAIAFPIFVVGAYLIDVKDTLSCITGRKLKKRADKDYIVEIEDEEGEAIHIEKYSETKKKKLWKRLIQERRIVQKKSSKDLLDKEEEKRDLLEECQEKADMAGNSRALYRIMAQRKVGGKKLEKSESKLDAQKADPLNFVDYDDNPYHFPPEPKHADDDYSNGYITFRKSKAQILEGGTANCPRTEKGNASVYLAVDRVNSGRFAKPVNIRYHTVQGTATAGADYTEILDGQLDFTNGTVRQVIQIEVIDDDVFEQDESFYVQLTENLDEINIKIHRCEVVILNDDDIKSFGDRVIAYLAFNHHKFKLGRSAWGEQIVDAITPPPKEASIFSKIWFWIMIPFAFLNSLVPPTTILGAFPTFFASLTVIGFLTAMINDLASLFGCQIGLSDAVTATTIVALGTSLPDTLASRIAAVNEPTADAAITNVTGSNTVNILLGLGLAWTIAAIYWESVPSDSSTLAKWKQIVPAQISEDYPNGAFYVPAGDLAFSVVIFACVSCIAFCILMIQRVIPEALPPPEDSGDAENGNKEKEVQYVPGGELGGKRRNLVAGIFIGLWLSFIVVTSLNSEGML